MKKLLIIPFMLFIACGGNMDEPYADVDAANNIIHPVEFCEQMIEKVCSGVNYCGGDEEECRRNLHADSDCYSGDYSEDDVCFYNEEWDPDSAESCLDGFDSLQCEDTVDDEYAGRRRLARLWSEPCRNLCK